PATRCAGTRLSQKPLGEGAGGEGLFRGWRWLCVFVLLFLPVCLMSGCALRAPRTIDPLLIFGEPGRGEGQFNMPRSVDFARDGSVIVMDRSDRIQRFTPDGAYLGAWHTETVQHGNPRGLSVAPNGEVYVADTHNSQVLVYSPA